MDWVILHYRPPLVVEDDLLPYDRAVPPRAGRNVQRLTIKMFAAEHPPPRFMSPPQIPTTHFSVIDCALLGGNIDSRNRLL